MRRRTCLALAGGLLSTGCLANGESPSTPTLSPEEGGSQQSTTMPPSESTDTFDPDSTFKTIGIFPNNRPHTVVIWNADDAARKIAVQIRMRPTESQSADTVLDAVEEFPADAALEIQLTEPANYTINVSAPADDGQTELRIAKDQFDCNSHKHQIAVNPDGSTDVSGLSTALACNPTTE